MRGHGKCDKGLKGRKNPKKPGVPDYMVKGIRKKKFQTGEAKKFINRTRALSKLNMNVHDFRKLAILKGIYPIVPNNPTQANHGKNPGTQVFYLAKDINFINQEPLLKKFEEQKKFVKKIKRLYGRRDQWGLKKARMMKPKYTLDHLVYERYPSFEAALEDLDDALCGIFLFATFPATADVEHKIVHMCRRLAVEFLNYVIYSRSLTKVFISIKGYYYEAEIMGKKIVWLQPHMFTQHIPDLVDLETMRTFLEFYVTLCGFVNFRLFQSLNLVYPPQIMKTDSAGEPIDADYLSAFNVDLAKKADAAASGEEVQIDEFPVDENDEENELSAGNAAVQRALRANKETQDKEEKFKNLFKGLKFFISREVPREQFAFVIRAFGGEVSWTEFQGPGSTFKEDDESITHQIIDRDSHPNMKLSRYYIQPQWIFDSINSHRLLPMEPYYPGKVLPPHVSPFQEENPGDYIPKEKKEMMKLRGEEVPDDTEDVDVDFEDETLVPLTEETPKPKLVTPGSKKPVRDAAEFPRKVDKEMLVAQLPQSRRRLIQKNKEQIQSKQDAVKKLKVRRKIAEKEKELDAKYGVKKSEKPSKNPKPTPQLPPEKLSNAARMQALMEEQYQKEKLAARKTRSKKSVPS